MEGTQIGIRNQQGTVPRYAMVDGMEDTILIRIEDLDKIKRLLKVYDVFLQLMRTRNSVHKLKN